MTDEATFLIGDTYFDGRNLMMITDADGFCMKMVALFRTRHKHDAVADADGELTSCVHQGSDGEVG